MLLDELESEKYPRNISSVSKNLVQDSELNKTVMSLVEFKNANSNYSECIHEFHFPDSLGYETPHVNHFNPDTSGDSEFSKKFSPIYNDLFFSEINPSNTEKLNKSPKITAFQPTPTCENIQKMSSELPQFEPNENLNSKLTTMLYKDIRRFFMSVPRKQNRSSHSSYLNLLRTSPSRNPSTKTPFLNSNQDIWLKQTLSTASPISSRSNLLNDQPRNPNGSTEIYFNCNEMDIKINLNQPSETSANFEFEDLVSPTINITDNAITKGRNNPEFENHPMSSITCNFVQTNHSNIKDHDPQITVANNQNQKNVSDSPVLNVNTNFSGIANTNQSQYFLEIPRLSEDTCSVEVQNKNLSTTYADGQPYRDAPRLLDQKTIILGRRDLARIRKKWSGYFVHKSEISPQSSYLLPSPTEAIVTAQEIDYEEEELAELFMPPCWKEAIKFLGSMSSSYNINDTLFRESKLPKLECYLRDEYDDFCVIIPSMDELLPLTSNDPNPLHQLNPLWWKYIEENSIEYFSKYTETLNKEILIHLSRSLFGRQVKSEKKTTILEKINNLYKQLTFSGSSYHVNKLIFELNLTKHNYLNDHNDTRPPTMMAYHPSTVQSRLIVNRSSVFRSWNFPLPSKWKLLRLEGPPLFFNTIREGMPYSINIPMKIPQIDRNTEQLVVAEYFLLPSSSPPESQIFNLPHRYNSNRLIVRNDPVRSGYWPIKPGQYFYAPSQSLQLSFRCGGESKEMCVSLIRDGVVEIEPITPGIEFSGQSGFLCIRNPTVYSRTPRLIQLMVVRKRPIEVDAIFLGNSSVINDKQINFTSRSLPSPLPPSCSNVPAAIKSKEDVIKVMRTLFCGGSAKSKDEICTDRIKVSLRCPILLTRMKKPARLPFCRHMQCFDESVLPKPPHGLKHNVPNVYKCPICGKTGSSYFIDGLCLEILSNAPDADEVYMKTENGSWSLINCNESPNKELSILSDEEFDIGRDFTGVALDESDVIVLDRLLSEGDLDTHHHSTRRKIGADTRRGSTIFDAIIID